MRLSQYAVRSKVVIGGEWLIMEETAKAGIEVRADVVAAWTGTGRLASDSHRVVPVGEAPVGRRIAIPGIIEGYRAILQLGGARVSRPEA